MWPVHEIFIHVAGGPNNYTSINQTFISVAGKPKVLTDQLFICTAGKPNIGIESFEKIVEAFLRL